MGLEDYYRREVQEGDIVIFPITSLLCEGNVTKLNEGLGEVAIFVREHNMTYIRHSQQVIIK
jgi:hypothetical protein